MAEHLTCNQDVGDSKSPGGTTLTAHQPVFMPWCGFFAKLMMADQLVWLDTVPLERHSWANRVQIKTQNGAQWLTVPIKLNGHLNKPIAEIEIAGTHWMRKHLRTIELAYSKAPYFGQYFTALKSIYDQEYHYLAGLNRALLDWLLAELKITMPVIPASEQDFRGHKSELVLDICRKMRADTYVFGKLGGDYADVAAFKHEGVTPIFQDYRHPRYPQLHGEFIAGLSIIDLLMNCGSDASTIIEAGIS